MVNPNRYFDIVLFIPNATSKIGNENDWQNALRHKLSVVIGFISFRGMITLAQ
jgi:hypothetical protein